MSLKTSTGSRPIPKGRWSEIEANGYRYVKESNRNQPSDPDQAAEQPSVFLRGSQTRRVPPPNGKHLDTAKPDFLSRALSWLRGDVPPSKQLRLVETVPLGEKRFVAIIHAEGHKYLVGGGASGVVLLTQLDGPQEPSGDPHSFAQLIEVAG